MKPPRSPQFLARETYRLRRLMDAARFLPALGAVLVLLPLMRHSPDAEAPPTASEGVYLFLVWFGLIVAAFLLSWGLRRTLDIPKTQAAPPERSRED